MDRYLKHLLLVLAGIVILLATAEANNSKQFNHRRIQSGPPKFNRRPPPPPPNSRPRRPYRPPPPPHHQKNTNNRQPQPRPPQQSNPHNYRPSNSKPTASAPQSQPSQQFHQHQQFHQPQQFQFGQSQHQSSQQNFNNQNGNHNAKHNNQQLNSQPNNQNVNDQPNTQTFNNQNFHPQQLSQQSPPLANPPISEYAPPLNTFKSNIFTKINQLDSPVIPHQQPQPHPTSPQNNTKHTITFTVTKKPSGATAINFQISTPKPFVSQPNKNPSTYRPPMDSLGYPDALYSMKKKYQPGFEDSEPAQTNPDLLNPPPLFYNPQKDVIMNKNHPLNHMKNEVVHDEVKNFGMDGKFSQPDPLYHPEETKHDEPEPAPSSSILIAGQSPVKNPLPTFKSKSDPTQQSEQAAQLLAALGLSKDPLINFDPHRSNTGQPMGLSEYLKFKQPLFNKPDTIIDDSTQDFVVSSSIQTNLTPMRDSGTEESSLTENDNIETYAHPSLRPPVDTSFTNYFGESSYVESRLNKNRQQSQHEPTSYLQNRLNNGPPNSGRLSDNGGRVNDGQPTSYIQNRLKDSFQSNGGNSDDGTSYLNRFKAQDLYNHQPQFNNQQQSSQQNPNQQTSYLQQVLNRNNQRFGPSTSSPSSIDSEEYDKADSLNQGLYGAQSQSSLYTDLPPQKVDQAVSNVLLPGGFNGPVYPKNGISGQQGSLEQQQEEQQFQQRVNLDQQQTNFQNQPLHPQGPFQQQNFQSYAQQNFHAQHHPNFQPQHPHPQQHQPNFQPQNYQPHPHQLVPQPSIQNFNYQLPNNPQSSASQHGPQNFPNHNQFGPTPVPQQVYVVTEAEPIIEIIVQDSNVTLPPQHIPTPPPYPPPQTPEPVHVFYVKYTENKFGHEPEINLESPIPSINVRGPDRNLQIGQNGQHHNFQGQYDNMPQHSEVPQQNQNDSEVSTTLRTIINPSQNTYTNTQLAVHFDQPPESYPFNMQQYQQKLLEQQQEQQNGEQQIGKRVGSPVSPEEFSTLLNDEQEQVDNKKELPADVPMHLKEQLINSGILNNADVQVVNFDENLFKELSSLPPEAISALQQQQQQEQQHNYYQSQQNEEEFANLQKRHVNKILISKDNSFKKPRSIFFTTIDNHVYKLNDYQKVSLVV